MRLRGIILALLCVGLSMAQGGLTLQQLSQLIQSSIKQLKLSDKEVAGYLRKQKLSFSLSDVNIEELQGMGAGPQTVAALKELQKTSRGLPAPPAQVAETPKPAKPVEPPPPPEEQERIIEEARDNALEYTKRLPDFICLQWTRQYYDQGGRDAWTKYGEIKTRLSYFEQKEDYTVISVNEQMTNKSYESLGGTIATGEFGSMLALLFAPESDAQFSWDHRGVLRGRNVYVFRAHIPRGRSQWRISYGPHHEQEVVAGYHGLVYIDKESLSILRLSMVTDDIPSGFPINEVRSALDYGYAKIADRDFLLPLHAELRMRESRVSTRNETEFRLYRKYSTETSITFDDEARDAKPEEDIKPAEPQN